MITQLEYMRFRGHDAKFVFGPGRNFIKGPNEAGKSTIKEAIAFAWMGTDADGTKNPDHLITVGQDAAQVNLSTASLTLMRRKKRGATSDIKRCREGLPDVKLSQSDLMGQIGISQDVFMSSWLVGHFMRLKSETKLKVLGEIAKIDRRQLLSTIVDINLVPAQVKFINPRIDAESVAGLRRAEQNKKQSFETQATSIKAQLSTIPAATLELDPKDHEMKIILHETVLQEHSLFKQNLPKWMAENEKRSQAVVRVAELTIDLEKFTADLKLKRSEYKKLGDEQDTLYNERVAMAEKKSALEKTKKHTELSLPKKPSAQEGTCTSCGQIVHGDHIASLMRDYESDVEKYNRHAREVADYNQKVDAQVAELSKALATSQASFDEYVKKVAQVDASGKQLSASVKKTEELLTQAKAYPTDLLPPLQLPHGDEADSATKRDALKAELHSYKMFVTQRKQLEDQLAQTSADILRHTEVILKYSAVEEALLKLPEMETAATLARISIDGLKVFLIDGDLVVTNTEDVDYRCLSDGRRMKVDVQICLALKKATNGGPDWIFIDNADLMDEEVYIPPGIQALIAQVDSSVKEVTVVTL